MWDHVIRCRETIKFRADFIWKLVKELIENKPPIINIKEILVMAKDILRYVEYNETEDYEMNQGLLGMTKLFHRYVIKVWLGVNFSKEDYKIINKILVRHCILFYIY